MLIDYGGKTYFAAALSKTYFFVIKISEEQIKSRFLQSIIMLWILISNILLTDLNDT
jgi:hypothetical protein